MMNERNDLNEELNPNQRNNALKSSDLFRSLSYLVELIPLDRTLILLQTQAELLQTQRLDKPYKSIFDIMKRIVSTEGILGLWRGSLTNILKSIAAIFVLMLFDAFIKKRIIKLFSPKTKDERERLNSKINNIFTFIALPILYPFDFIQYQLSMDVATKATGKEFTGIIDVFKKTIARKGWKGLYTGFWLLFAIKLLSTAVFYVLMDLMIAIKQKPKSSLYLLPPIISSISVFPFLIIKRRMIAASLTSSSYRNPVDAYLSIVKKEGYQSLFTAIFYAIFHHQFFSVVSELLDDNDK